MANTRFSNYLRTKSEEFQSSSLVISPPFTPRLTLYNATIYLGSIQLGRLMECSFKLVPLIQISLFLNQSSRLFLCNRRGKFHFIVVGIRNSGAKPSLCSTSNTAKFYCKGKNAFFRFISRCCCKST